jgi:hypothetical protein
MSKENHDPKVEIATPTKPQDDARRPRRPIIEVVPEEDGERLALESGVTEPLPEHLEIINRSSGALGDEEWERRWDPEHKPSDAMLAQEHEANLQRRAEFEKQIRQRRAEHRESEDALAAVPAGGPKPSVHWLFQLVVTAIIAISIAPTLREDLFAPIEDNFWGWVAALSVGVALALTVVTVALWAHRKPNDLPPLMRRMGLFAGLLMVVGCVLLRLRSMESAGDALWALALMAIELAAVLFVEFQAAKLEGALKEWETCRSVEDGKARLRDSALAELERQVALCDEVQRKLDEHIRDIADRQPRFASREETIAAITNRKLNGYHIGIAKNRGFLLGTVRRSR